MRFEGDLAVNMEQEHNRVIKIHGQPAASLVKVGSEFEWQWLQSGASVYRCLAQFFAWFSALSTCIAAPVSLCRVGWLR